MGYCFGPPNRPCCEYFCPGSCCAGCCWPRRPRPGPMYGGGMYGPPRGGYGPRLYYWWSSKVVKILIFILYERLNDQIKNNIIY